MTWLGVTWLGVTWLGATWLEQRGAALAFLVQLVLRSLAALSQLEHASFKRCSRSLRPVLWCGCCVVTLAFAVYLCRTLCWCKKVRGEALLLTDQAAREAEL